MLTLLQANYLSFFHWVLLTSVRASVFIIFLMGVKFVLRHKMGARFQYLVWVVLITGLVLPWTPSSSISVNNFLDSSRLQQIITAIFGQTSHPSATLVENEQSILDQTAVVNSDSGQAVGSTETQPAGDYIPFVYNLMFWIWFSGVLTFTVLTVLVNKRFSAKIEDDWVTDPRLLLDFNQLKVKLKIKADISLLKSGNVNSPALLGLVHPRLLLPIGIEQAFSLKQVNHIFLHELLHFKRKDIWINWLTQILIISHWFNPLIWYAFCRMREDQEIACDALAIARLDTEQAKDYAYTLVKLAETYSVAPRMASLASLSGSKSQIKQRVIRISKLKQASVKWSLLGILVIGLIAFATFSSAKMDTNPITQGNSAGQTLEATKGVDPGSGITIEDITGPNFKGKVMLIKDPKRVKLAVSQEIGVTGERVSDLVKDTGAVAGINAGGFYDPDGKGNGAFPDGLTMHDGLLVHNNIGDQAVNIVGFNDQGKLVIGNMTAKQLAEKNLCEAVSFGPNLIVDGKSEIDGDGGWGIAPRTGIGQRADGTVIFVVIDGRQPTWSIGATLSDLRKVFVDYQAVNAVNLDGGSSSEILYNGKVLNKLSNIFGERYIPTAFVVTS